MVRGLLNKLVSRSLSVAGKWQNQQLRRLQHPRVVVKSQILAGGRGLGTFKSGLQGGVHIVKKDQVEDIAGNACPSVMPQLEITLENAWANTSLPNRLVLREKLLARFEIIQSLYQKYASIFSIHVYLCQKLSLVNEMYFAITLDRKTAGPLIIACRKGGTSIEDLAEKFPDMIVKVPVDVFEGITDEDAAKVVDGLAPKGADRNKSIEQVKNLYKLFVDSDCTLLEINPLAETADNQLVAADAKLNFDDNAAYRQKEIFALRDTTQEDPREVAAAKADLNYIGLDGEIGCMVNGAGLAMATMDIIKLHGGTPANFLDVGGNASENQCDVIASGIVNAAKQVALKVPVIVRLEGTNVDQGKRILKESGMALITAEDLDDAAQKAVKAAYK
ncbi:Succinyl-CoA synthetase-like [Sesbania bispinosa]|nr:Succinyl-CoA synthetase-like [Sesbania bispinosa]